MSAYLDENCHSVQIICLIVQKKLTLDPITDLFNTMHVASVVHSRLEATAPWGLVREAELAKQSATHSAADGTLKPFPLAGGDCFLLAPGSAYALRDTPRTHARSFCEVAPKHRSNVIHYGGGGVSTTIVSGWFRFGQMSVKPMKRLLP